MISLHFSKIFCLQGVFVQATIETEFILIVRYLFLFFSIFSYHSTQLHSATQHNTTQHKMMLHCHYICGGVSLTDQQQRHPRTLSPKDQVAFWAESRTRFEGLLQKTLAHFSDSKPASEPTTFRGERFIRFYTALSLSLSSNNNNNHHTTLSTSPAKKKKRSTLSQTQHTQHPQHAKRSQHTQRSQHPQQRRRTQHRNLWAVRQNKLRRLIGARIATKRRRKNLKNSNTDTNKKE